MITANSPQLTRQDDLVRRGLKFSQLRLLAALRDLNQIGAAASHLGMTQPAASRLLAQMEAMVGTALYTRHPRGIVLTEAGQVLADQACETLRDLDHAYHQVAQIRGGTRGQISIGAVTGPSLELLLPALRTARVAFPDVEVTVRIETSNRLADGLLAGEIDFYLGRIPTAADMRMFAIEMIGSEPISLVVHPDHPLTQIPNLQLADCLTYDWVMQPPGGLLRRTVETYLLEHGLPLPRRLINTTSTLFILALINETDAVAPLAQAVARFFKDPTNLGGGLNILPVAPDMAVEKFGLVCRAGDAPGPVAARVLELVRQQAWGPSAQT